MISFYKTMCADCAGRLRLTYKTYKILDSDQIGRCPFCGRHLRLNRYQCVKDTPPMQRTQSLVRHGAGGGERARAIKLQS